MEAPNQIRTERAWCTKTRMTMLPKRDTHEVRRFNRASFIRTAFAMIVYLLEATPDWFTIAPLLELFLSDSNASPGPVLPNVQHVLFRFTVAFHFDDANQRVR
jgi:hypothetical protein